MIFFKPDYQKTLSIERFCPQSNTLCTLSNLRNFSPARTFQVSNTDSRSSLLCASFDRSSRINQARIRGTCARVLLRSGVRLIYPSVSPKVSVRFYDLFKAGAVRRHATTEVQTTRAALIVLRNALFIKHPNGL